MLVLLRRVIDDHHCVAHVVNVGEGEADIGLRPLLMGLHHMDEPLDPEGLALGDLDDGAQPSGPALGAVDDLD
jgi:hypothetical protein